MSKTVTIPNCKNPYVVIINNKKYIYTAGETVEVPDEVAEVIEAHITAQHTVPAKPNGGGRTSIGATADWELVGEVVSDGSGDLSGISIPIDFSKYTEVYICAEKLAATKNRRIMVRKSLAWHNGATIANMGSTDVLTAAYANEYIVSVWIKVIAGRICGHWSSNSGYVSGATPLRQIENPRGVIDTSYAYISLDTNNNGAIPEGETLTIYAR